MSPPFLLSTLFMISQPTTMHTSYSPASILVMAASSATLLEAQAAGLPIVAFACKCGPKDVISDGEDGLLIPEGDIAGLAAGMKRLMDDEALRKKMGAAAFRHSDRFDKERIMALWENLFRELS